MRMQLGKGSYISRITPFTRLSRAAGFTLTLVVLAFSTYLFITKFLVHPDRGSFQATAYESEPLLQGPSTRETSLPFPSYVPLKGPWVVAIQPGHWKVEELPEELSRLRNNTGAVYGEVREVDINIQVATLVLEKVQSLGWKGQLIPATVPAGLQADAFISIHADYGNGNSREGWKLSPPFRASSASRLLATSFEEAFQDLSTGTLKSLSSLNSPSNNPFFPGFPPPSNTPPTVNMRGYFGFNFRRYENSMSPYTPAVLIELGYLAN
ncbi:MAG: hypothetical protein SNJ78_05120, partial [Spirochaetales bacterium]